MPKRFLIVSQTVAKTSPIGILVTRPANQNQNLVRLIKNAGDVAIVFPALEIKGNNDSPELNNVINNLESFSMAIFISPNAVEHALESIFKHHNTVPPHIKLACVGRGSALKLAEYGYSSTLTPEEKYNSESLLALPELQQVKGEKIVIFRGNGGRNVLYDTLTARGAHVVYGECYRRVKPDTGNEPLIEFLKNGTARIITTTSAEAIRNLYEMAAPETSALLEIPVIAISDRIATVCSELGFKKIIITDNASDEAIVSAIEQWKSTKNNL